MRFRLVRHSQLGPRQVAVRLLTYHGAVVLHFSVTNRPVPDSFATTIGSNFPPSVVSVIPPNSEPSYPSVDRPVSNAFADFPNSQILPRLYIVDFSGKRPPRLCFGDRPVSDPITASHDSVVRHSQPTLTTYHVWIDGSN